MGQVTLITWELGLNDNMHVSIYIGNTSRLCDSLGNWHVPDVRSCSSTIYQNLFERICNVRLTAIVYEFQLCFACR